MLVDGEVFPTGRSLVGITNNVYETRDTDLQAYSIAATQRYVDTTHAVPEAPSGDVATWEINKVYSTLSLSDAEWLTYNGVSLIEDGKTIVPCGLAYVQRVNDDTYEVVFQTDIATVIYQYMFIDGEVIPTGHTRVGITNNVYETKRTTLQAYSISATQQYIENCFAAHAEELHITTDTKLRAVSQLSPIILGLQVTPETDGIDAISVTGTVTDAPLGVLRNYEELQIDGTLVCTREDPTLPVTFNIELHGATCGTNYSITLPEYTPGITEHYYIHAVIHNYDGVLGAYKITLRALNAEYDLTRSQGPHFQKGWTGAEDEDVNTILMYLSNGCFKSGASFMAHAVKYTRRLSYATGGLA
jgi:hypothetical protein